MGNKQAQRIEQAREAGAAAAKEMLASTPTGQCKSAAFAPPGRAGVMSPSDPKPELIYFNGPGRGELTRLAFAAGGIDFVDTRVTFGGEEWPAMKNDPTSVPAQCFGSMPCIKHGETLIAQSRSTAVYAAELGIWAQGALGSSDDEMARNGATEMMALGAHADAQAAMYKCLFGDDASKAKGKEALPAAAKVVLDGLERALARKACSGPYFFCESGPTLADLAVYNMVSSPFPGLKALGIKTHEHPNISKIVEAVPKDPRIDAYIRRTTKPELIYFDGPGRARLTRLAFKVGGIDFTDTRIAQPDWPALKQDRKSVPAQCFGSMPCIKHGGMLLAQSEATAMYAAQIGIWSTGCLGSTASDQARNRATEVMILGAHADIQAAMYKCLFGDDESKAKGKEALPASIKPTLEGLERVLGRKTCSGPYFFSESVPTLADLAVYDMVTSPFPGLKALGIDLAPYAKLSAIVDAVSNEKAVESV